jgi:uncharacterized Zn-binding protein involved in type VI secretion
MNGGKMYRIAIITIIIVLICFVNETHAGKPAARLGDATMHGGTITMGCATVLIGGKPAARVGDMHVCPMLNPGVPPTPHVGGPISMGSPCVLIGGMPAARMGDPCVCEGPPDTIAMGCMTVLIGDCPGAQREQGGGGTTPTGKSQQDTSRTIQRSEK